MPRKRLILHIGMPKTGTSSIQQTLHDNRHVLASLGVIYPELGQLHGGAHHSWVKLITNANSQFAPPSIDSVDALKLLDTIRLAKDQNTIILSSEGFWNKTGFQHFLPEIVEGFRITIVVLLRHPISYVDSLVNQGSKMRLYPQWEHLPDHSGWRDHIPKYYMDILTMWRDATFVDDLKVGLFDGKRDAWQQFAELADPRLLGSISSAKDRYNVSFRPEALAFLKDYVSLKRERTLTEASIIFNVLEDYSRNKNAEDPRLFTLLPPEASEYINAKFEADMRAVEREFLGGKAVFEPPPMRRSYVDIDSIGPAELGSVKDYIIERLCQHTEYLSSLKPISQPASA